MPITTASPSAIYRLVMNDEPVAVTELLGSAKKVLDYYLELENLSCCSVLGGFVISADGEIAMGETDEVSMSETWLPAIIRLQHGESSAWVWPWEESNLTLTREGGWVEMEDVHPSGTVVCPRVRFRLDAFARAMLDASRPMASFVDVLHTAIEEYLSDSSRYRDEESIDRLRFLRQSFSPEWASWITEIEARLSADDRERP